MVVLSSSAPDCAMDKLDISVIVAKVEAIVTLRVALTLISFIIIRLALTTEFIK